MFHSKWDDEKIDSPPHFGRKGPLNLEGFFLLVVQRLGQSFVLSIPPLKADGFNMQASGVLKALPEIISVKGIVRLWLTGDRFVDWTLVAELED